MPSPVVSSSFPERYLLARVKRIEISSSGHRRVREWVWWVQHFNKKEKIKWAKLRGATRGLDPKYTEDFHCPQNNRGMLSCSFQTRTSQYQVKKSNVQPMYLQISELIRKSFHCTLVYTSQLIGRQTAENEHISNNNMVPLNPGWSHHR